MYENQTQEAILTRMLDNIDTSLNKKEGSFIYDAVSPTSIELAQAYIELDKVLGLGFAQTTYGTYLDYRAEEHGITRKAATKAQGTLVITGVANLVIPEKSIFASETGIQFTTDEEVTIGEEGIVSVPVTAVAAGKEGNLPTEAIREMPMPILGVTQITNPQETTGGKDTETDQSLLDRLLLKVREPATSGNIDHYRQWVLEVPGVGDAKIFPLWNGSGTVKIVIVDSEKKSVSPSLVSETTQYVETVRPIGADVTVKSAEDKEINVSARVVLANGFTIGQVQELFQNALTDYLKETAFIGTYVSYAKIGSLILALSGIGDYNNLTVNGIQSNISLTEEEVPVLGTISLEV
ncbi:MAG: baseplate J/gp47 family protein [Clostridia bacterium]|nr:baseplate J/gp47 family protein [Clostridia bacterium]